jgi:outer membrane receptor protein involved in Fe transport
MNLKRFSFVAALVVTLAPFAVAQSLTGALAGQVKDEQGGALPGANVTLSGKTGSRTAVSDASGSYRFPALEPGSYTLTAELAGFQPRRTEAVQVSVGGTVNVDFALKVGTQTETVEVVGEAPVVDVTSSATSNALSQDMLFNIPIRPTNAATQLLNFAPGVNFGSAFGGDADTANGLLLDGVDTRDPEAGSAWTFFSYNLVDEVQIQGLGAPAEYGAFTGVVVNTLTKSGGNAWSGLFDAYYRNDSLEGNNVTQGVIAENPSLQNAAVTNKEMDLTAQFSGPLVKDKLFFFLSAERYELDQDPSGPRTIRHEVSPRLNAKFTFQPGPNDTLNLMLQKDEYNVTGRPGVAAGLATDELTNREDAPGYTWGASWRHLFGPNTFVEAKFTGWTGYFDLNPEVTAPGHFDAFTGTYSDSQGWFYYADRGRNQLNASISHYAEAFGHHDMKFGIEIERSRVRNRYGFIDDIFYYDYSYYYEKGQYTAYDYGYDIEGRNKRESAYLQDAWKVNDRLTLNLGVRFDWVKGYPAENSQAADGSQDKVYDAKSVAPRLGFAFDLTGDQKTVLKGSYSQYYEGSFFGLYNAAITGTEDFVLYASDPSGEKCGPLGNCFTEYARSPFVPYAVDPDIKQPRVDEFTLGMERALTKDFRLAVTGIYRKDKNLQGSVNPSARWIQDSVTTSDGNDPSLSGIQVPVYQWVNQDESIDDFVLTNPDGFEYRDPDGNVLGTAKASRQYKGLMFVLDKRMANRWMGRVSYVLSKTEGTMDNSGFNSYGLSRQFETPTWALVNSDGPLSNDVRHEVKVMLSYQIPKVEIAFSGYMRSISGGTYTPYERFSSGSINFPFRAGREPFIAPRGSFEYPTINLVDLRAEKIFSVNGGHDRISIYGDANNIFNKSTVTDINSRWPEVGIAGYDQPVAMGGPLALTAPRRFTLGARWQF